MACEDNPCPCSAGQGGGNGGGGGGSGEPAEGGARCGVERWPVKTLSDRRARQVNFHPRRTNVDALRSKPTPGVGFSTPRITGVETTTYKLRAQLIEYAREDDHDIHLVIAAPSNPEKTMIVEFPDPSCPGARKSRNRKAMGRARQAVISACGAPSTSFHDLNGTATIRGVASSMSSTARMGSPQTPSSYIPCSGSRPTAIANERGPCVEHATRWP